MLDWEVVQKYDDEGNEGNEGGSTIKREHGMNINIMFLHVQSW
jgi:hypothetical protein